MSVAFQYSLTPTNVKFHNSTARVRGLKGPYGSGKTTAMVQELLHIAARQEPAADNVRYTHFGIIRATYPLLLTTARRSLMEVFPDSCGYITKTAPLEGLYKIPLPDGTMAHIELTLLSVDDEEAVKKLNSTNWTAAWISEPTEVPLAVFTRALGRTGRFPTGAKGRVSESGIIMEYNPPPEGHWLEMYEASPPEGHEYLMQPPAAFKIKRDDGTVEYRVNLNAENLQNLEGGPEYYRKQIIAELAAGNDDTVDHQFCLLPTHIRTGKPVFGSFREDFHVAKEPLRVIANQPVIVGFDTSGNHPSVAFFQYQNGMWCIIDELYGDGIPQLQFFEDALIPLCRNEYGDTSLLFVCDPSNTRDAWHMVSPVQRLLDAGFEAIVAPSNKPAIRISAVEELLNKRSGGLLISPTCDLTIRAFEGGYKYKASKIKGTMGRYFEAEPDKKSIYSHIADAVQYGVLHILYGENANKMSDEERAIMTNRVRTRTRIM